MQVSTVRIESNDDLTGRQSRLSIDRLSFRKLFRTSKGQDTSVMFRSEDTFRNERIRQTFERKDSPAPRPCHGIANALCICLKKQRMPTKKRRAGRAKLGDGWPARVPNSVASNKCRSNGRGSFKILSETRYLRICPNQRQTERLEQQSLTGE